jgi:chromate transport protein ChrA
MEDLITAIMLGSIVLLIALAIFFRMVRKLKSYRKEIGTIFLLSILLIAVSWIISPKHRVVAGLLSHTGFTLGIAGFSIAVWEEFKRGIREVE